MTKPLIPQKIAPDLLDRLKQRFGPFPLFQGWELTIESVAPGKATLRVGYSEKVRNTKGNVHGGVQAAVADSACALALSTVFDGAMPFSTSDMHIRFLEPASGPMFAEAEILRLSARSSVLECKLKCDGQMVALCTTHFTLRSFKGA